MKAKILSGLIITLILTLLFSGCFRPPEIEEEKPFVPVEEELPEEVAKVCDPVECAKNDIAQCIGFNKEIIEYHCTVRQECLGVKRVEENSPNCGYLEIEKPRAIGESAEMEGRRVTVSAVEETSSYSWYYVVGEKIIVERAANGKKFVIFEITVKNTAAAEVKTNRNNFLLFDEEQNKYFTQPLQGLEAFPTQFLALGMKVSGKILFEVPQEKNDFILQYTFSKPKELYANWEVQLE